MPKIEMIKCVRDNIIDTIISKEKLEQLNVVCKEYNNYDLAHKIYENIQEEVYLFISECIINEYHDKRICNQIVGDDRESRISFFNEHFARNKEFAFYFLKKYSILDDLLRIRVNDLLDFNLEIIRNYNKDLHLLNKLLKFQLGKIKEIPLKAGDLHNGRAVSIVKCENGKIVYKPRNLGTDIFIEKIMSYISTILPNCPYFRFPKNLCFQNYSWQEFIERKECETIQQVHKYYYRSGIYLAVFYLLTTMDMHYENMVSCGEHPIFIDLETIIRGEQSELTAMQDNKIDYKSVLVSNMLPAISSDGIFDINMSALFTGNHKSKKLFNTYVAPDEKLDWVYVKENVVIEGKDNRLLYMGKEIEPWKVQNDVINGFEETLKVIIKNKKEFIDFLKTISQDIKIRQVLRPTQVYWKFVSASHHPNCLSSIEKCNEIWDILFSNFTIGNHGFLRVEKEVSDLKRGYIPSFYTLLNNRNLYSDGERICKNYFYETPLQTAIKKIESMDESMVDYQIRFIKMSFLTLYGLDRSKLITGLKNDKAISELLTNNDVKGMLQEYTSYLVKNLIPLENDFYSIVMPYIGLDGFHMQGMESELYQVGGLIWFLAVYSKIYDNKYTKYPKGMLNTLITKYIKESPDLKDQYNFSLYNGVGGLLYMTYNFYKLFKDKFYFDISVEIINDIIDYYSKVDLLELIDTDFYRGLPGTLFLICKIFLDNQQSLGEGECPIVKLDDLVFIGDRFLNFISTNSNDTYGITHGITGLSITVSILYRITKNKKYSTMLKSLLIKENLLDDPNKKLYTWCKGKSGVLLSRHIMLQYCKDNKELSDIIISTMPKVDKKNINLFFELNEYCVCHGIYGNIDVFISIMNKSDINDYCDFIYKKYFNSLLDIKWFEHSDYPYEASMLGSSGVAYTLMRLYNDLPSILSLDIY
ncbi:type 2 lantipeptide synthetase LanM [Clostridium sporogenes]|uniref:type 2 lanthipeptide synthetase LanM family protein n=1 Tax=unclassified Clostridium TaxID=2614128 RepID=UPI0013D08D96|nr:type 2 lantipeptide synthetase LanM [Clostridium sporogenes]NFS25459.1 type 2 lantipeptide synthetase LanM [Clostridium sporogenes]